MRSSRTCKDMQSGPRSSSKTPLEYVVKAQWSRHCIPKPEAKNLDGALKRASRRGFGRFLYEVLKKLAESQKRAEVADGKRVTGARGEIRTTDLLLRRTRRTKNQRLSAVCIEWCSRVFMRVFTRRVIRRYKRNQATTGHKIGHIRANGPRR